MKGMYYGENAKKDQRSSFVPTSTSTKGRNMSPIRTDMYNSCWSYFIAFVGALEHFEMKDVTREDEFPAEFPADIRNQALDFGWDTFDEETQLFKKRHNLSSVGLN